MAFRHRFDTQPATTVLRRIDGSDAGRGAKVEE
jgi:hypothetical protein